MTQENLSKEIEMLIREEFEGNKVKFGRQPEKARGLTQMFKNNMQIFKKYLQDDLSPKILNLDKVFFKHNFDSPLDFIMIKSDFKRFFESFTQARLSLLYSLELHKDSMFTLDDVKQTNQLSISNLLYKNFEAEVQEMSTILEEYHHLIEHDNFDCQTHVSGENFLFKCWFRRYGFPILSLAGFVIYGYFKVMATIAHI